MKFQKFIILDRDGVLNEMVVDAEHGTIDSPLHPSQVRVVRGVPEALKILSDLGYGLAIATNQPAAAKGKTTLANLEATHAEVLKLVQQNGAKIQSSHICFHRAEDNCACRKPKNQLLQDAMKLWVDNSRECWMVGDGVTDIQAGQSLGLKTAFFGPKKTDAMRIFEDLDLNPLFWGKSLLEFAKHLLAIQEGKSQ